MWLIAASVMVVVQAAADAGVSTTRVLSSGMFPLCAGRIGERTRMGCGRALCAAVLSGASRLVLRWEWHVPLMIPAIVGVVAVPVTGDAGQGPDHDYTTGSMIVFALAVSVWAGTEIVGGGGTA